MRKLLTCLFAVAALSAPAAAHAQLSLGLRLAYAPSFGDAVEDGELSDGVRSQIPVQVDAMYRLNPSVSLGGYFSYGFGQVGKEIEDVCDLSGVDCSASVLRAGVQGVYTFTPAASFAPWVGIGAGYEWASLHLEEGGDEARLSYRGFEFVNLQVGGDYRVNERFAVGPFVAFSLAQYSDVEVDDGTTTLSESIDEKGVHEWLQFGLRGRFDL